MRPPAFWYRPLGLRARLLAPLSWLYAYGTARRLRRSPRSDPGVPVICVGNINVGGTGKTPTVIALLSLLQEMGHVPHVVSRGYGGTLQGPVAVDPSQHDAHLVGDEPLIVVPFAPVWIAKDRAAGALRAVRAGATVVVLDDGFQNPDLRYDFSLVVVDAARGFGNGAVLPAGPLREPVDVGLARADALMSIGGDAAQTRFRAGQDLPAHLAHFTAKLEAIETGMDWRGTRVFAFAGIGDPEKFFATLRVLGADIVASRALEDHQPLEAPLMKRLLTDAQRHNAQLVTTEKDAVRLPAEFRSQVLSLPVRLVLDEPEKMRAALSNAAQPV